MKLDKDLIVDRVSPCVDMIDEAYDIFNGTKDAKFSDDKAMITDLFSKTNNGIDGIKLRLVVIDSLYSTNMSKTVGGFESLAETICGIDNIDARFINFFEGARQDKIEILFKKRYGYSVDGVKSRKARAISLITKYAYFLTNYQFPIYDKFVRGVLVALSNEKDLVPMKKEPSGEMPDNFFDVMHAIAEALGQDGVDRFDAFCWLAGRINADGQSSIDRLNLIYNLDKTRIKKFRISLVNLKLIHQD